MEETPPWEKINESCFRHKKRRITVAKSSASVYDNKGELCPSLTWIFYRDSHGFAEGVFSSAEEAMKAADSSTGVVQTTT
jgi:hypothetical protein